MYCRNTLKSNGVSRGGSYLISDAGRDRGILILVLESYNQCQAPGTCRLGEAVLLWVLVQGGVNGRLPEACHHPQSV